MYSRKSKVELYREKLKERGLYENYILDNRNENKNNNNLIQNHLLNNNKDSNIININDKSNNNFEYQNQKDNLTFIQNINNNISDFNDNMKQKWFNSQFQNKNFETGIPSKINLKNPEYYTDRYRNNDIYVINNYNLSNIPYSLSRNIKNTIISQTYEDILNKNNYEKRNISNSIDYNFNNEKLNRYRRTPLYGNNSSNNYNTLRKELELEDYKKRKQNMNFERVKSMNTLFEELNNTKKLENKMIEDWRRNSGYLGYKYKKEWDNDDKKYKLKRENIDLENQINVQLKKLKEEKWEKEIELNEKKYYYNIKKDEINKLEKELNDKDEQIKKLELSTQILQNKYNDNDNKNEKEKENIRKSLNLSENKEKKLNDRNKELNFMLNNNKDRIQNYYMYK